MPTRINGYTEKTTVVNTDEFEIQETGNGTTKKATAVNIVLDMIAANDLSSINGVMSLTALSTDGVLASTVNDLFLLAPNGSVELTGIGDVNVNSNLVVTGTKDLTIAGGELIISNAPNAGPIATFAGNSGAFNPATTNGLRVAYNFSNALTEVAMINSLHKTTNRSFEWVQANTVSTHTVLMTLDADGDLGLLTGNLRVDGGFSSNAAAGQALIYGSTTLGGVLAGSGSTNDVTIQNKNGANVISVLTNSLDVAFAGRALVTGGITILTGTHVYGAGVLGFSDSGHGFLFRPPRVGSLNAHLFEAFDGTDLVSIDDSSGDLEVRKGNLTISISGKGIDFSATAQAVGMTSELFDDYEEGTWTPTLQDDSLSDGESQTYTVQVGTYSKIGNRVFINGRMTVNSLGSLSAGDVANMAGFPFATDATSNNHSALCISEAASLSISAGTYVSATIIANSTRCSMRNWDLTGGTSGLTIAEFSTAGDILFGGQYPAA